MALRHDMFMCLMLCATAWVSTVHAANTCWITAAVRNGNGVKVTLYTPKGNPRGVGVPMTIIRVDGARTFINQTTIAPTRLVTTNPRTHVTLYPGDRLGFAGMDYGCTVSVVRVAQRLELKIEGGLPRVPGMDSHYVNFMPVQDESDGSQAQRAQLQLPASKPDRTHDTTSGR